MKIENEVKKYLEYVNKELNYSINTLEVYENDLNVFIKFLNFKKINYLSISKDEIMLYLKYLDKFNYTNKTISRNLSSIRAFYTYLVEVNILNSNIFKRIRNPKIEKKLPNYLSEDEVEIILSELKEDNPVNIRNKFLFELLYSTGLRVSEVSNIKLNDIDITYNKIIVLGKGNKERIVYFGNNAKILLKKYLKARYFFIKTSTDYLFLNGKGTKLSRQSIEGIIKNIMRNSVVNHKISPHTLRHTYATHLLDNGADLKSVQELLGHENLETTEIYTHISNERLKNEYKKYHPNKNRQ